MTGFNPFRKRFGDSATLRVVGNMTLKGESVSLLSSESENSIITLAVRDRDGLVINSIARANRSGDIGAETIELAYEYFPVPKDAAIKYKLLVPSGAKTIAFPKKKSAP